MKKSFKKIIACLVAVSTFVLCFAGLACSSNNYDRYWHPYLMFSGGYQGVEVIGVKDEIFTLTDIVIPDTIDDVPIVGIGARAFENCKNLDTVVMPESVLRIGNYAFSGCTGLSGMYIPQSVKFLGNGVFYECTGIKEIAIPEGVEFLYENLFARCTNLNSISLPQSLTSISKHAFDFCTSLSEIVVPESVTSIGDFAFSGCSNLTAFNFPSNIESVGIGIFSYCGQLASITLSAENENYYVEGNCLISRDENVLLAGCNNSVMPVEDSVKIIEAYSFTGLEELDNIVIPEGVETINENAFAWCSGIESVLLPKSLTYFSVTCFNFCDSLTTLNVAEGNKTFVSEGNCIINLDKNEVVLGCNGSQIPHKRNIQSIGSRAFYSCRKLNTLTIPDSVERINSGAFDYCSDLRRIYYYGTQEQWNGIQIDADLSKIEILYLN